MEKASRISERCSQGGIDLYITIFKNGGKGGLNLAAGTGNQSLKND
jgi:hypothetical protein